MTTKTRMSDEGFYLLLYCGLRFCDVKDLTYKNVDYANRLLKFEQKQDKGTFCQ